MIPAVILVAFIAVSTTSVREAASLRVAGPTPSDSSTDDGGFSESLFWIEELASKSGRAAINESYTLQKAALEAAVQHLPAPDSDIQAGADPKFNWPNWGAGILNTRHAVLETKISPNNVDTLKVKKGWPVRVFGDVSATPTVVNGTVYVVDWGFPNYLFNTDRFGPAFVGDGHLTAVDAQTGRIKWTREVRSYTGINGFSRTSPAVEGDILVIGTGHGGVSYSARVPNSTFVIGVNATTGDMLWKTLVEAHPLAIVTMSPTIYHGGVYFGVASLEEAIQEPLCCSFKGSAQKLDLYTGELLWKFVTVPDGFYGAALWGSSPSIDVKRNQVYYASGNNYLVPKEVSECYERNEGNYTLQAACSPPDNHYDSVLALDLDTGQLRWNRRLADNDVFTLACKPQPGILPYDNCTTYRGPDYDFAQAPMLILGTSGRSDLVVVGQKSGMAWALHPDSGEVVWATYTGAGSFQGGMMFGSATDGIRIYMSNNNYRNPVYKLINPPPGGKTKAKGGFLTALDLDGNILWQSANPFPAIYQIALGGDIFSASNIGPVSVANNVVYWPSLDPQGKLIFVDARTGQLLGSFSTGVPIGSLGGGASIYNGSVYVGSGYAQAALPSLTWTVWALTLPTKKFG